MVRPFLPRRNTSPVLPLDFYMRGGGGGGGAGLGLGHPKAQFLCLKVAALTSSPVHTREHVGRQASAYPRTRQANPRGLTSVRQRCHSLSVYGHPRVLTWLPCCCAAVALAPRLVVSSCHHTTQRRTVRNTSSQDRFFTKAWRHA